MSSLSASSYLFDGFSTGQHQFHINGSGNWFLYNGSGGSSDGAADTNAHIITARWASATDIARLDETEIINADTGNSGSDGLTVGDAGGAEGLNSNVKVGQLMVYDPSASGYSVSEVEGYLIGKWGPF